MDKKDFNDVYKLMQETSKLQACSSKNCSDLKMKLMNDKKFIAIDAKYKSEKNEKKKDKLLDTISKNELLYNYNKCILNNCKKIFKKFFNIIKVVLNKIPKSHPDYDKLHKMIGELEDFFKLKNMTKEQHEIYVKNIEKLMTAISKQ
jgi:hypothetical protein